MVPVLTAAEVARRIPDGATIAFPGNLSIMVADHLLQAIETRFLETGTPRGLTVFEPCNAANGEGTGIERFAHPGMTRRVIASAFPMFKPTRITDLILAGTVEGYNFPMGVLYSLAREIGAGRPGVLTEVGLGTFIDPEQTGGQLHPARTEELVERIRLGGRDLLFYKSFPIDVTLLKATTADRDGNLSIENEPLSLGILSLVIAAKASGGRVYVQVERLVDAGAVEPKRVAVPGAFVDGVVLAPDAPQSGLSRYDPTVTGQARATLGRDPVQVGAQRVILARAAASLAPGWLVNLGVGIPNALPQLLRETGCEDLVGISTEHGAIGGLPNPPPAFGSHVNPSAILDPTDTFNFYTGGVLDATFLGLAQADRAGNVNVTKFGGRVMGVGGFVDITARTKRIFICGTLAAGRFEIAVADGAVSVVREGDVPKLVESVEQITLNGQLALDRGQEVTMITERGAFRLGRDGWTLVEVAPGIVPERDIAPMLRFALQVAPNLRPYAAEIVAPPSAVVSAWLRRTIEARGR